MSLLFTEHRFDTVLHFAALSIVGASMRDPLHYIAENVAHSLNLANAAIKAGCLRFVLSSTAALFGDPDRTGSPLYYSGTGDSGGVHHNSGVGNKFADETRKMHYGEAAKRSIYGEATQTEAKELRDEGARNRRIRLLAALVMAPRLYPVAPAASATTPTHAKPVNDIALRMAEADGFVPSLSDSQGRHGLDAHARPGRPV